MRLAADDLCEEDGEFHLVSELNECRLGTIRFLLQGQSAADVSAFETAVEQQKAQGYELTGLLVHLRCPSAEGMPKKWTWDVRPKLDAEPRRVNL